MLSTKICNYSDTEHGKTLTYGNLVTLEKSSFCGNTISNYSNSHCLLQKIHLSNFFYLKEDIKCCIDAKDQDILPMGNSEAKAQAFIFCLVNCAFKLKRKPFLRRHFNSTPNRSKENKKQTIYKQIKF